MEKTKIVIDRSKWRTGRTVEHATGKGTTHLRNGEGFMCCLGFLCSQVDPDLHIDGISSPEFLARIIPEITCQHKNRYRALTKLGVAAIGINDAQIKEKTDPDYIGVSSREDREQQLTDLFSDSPYELEFVGEYTDYTWD